MFVVDGWGAFDFYTCRVTVQHALQHLALLGGAARPRLTGHVVEGVTLAALRAVQLRDPAGVHLTHAHTHAHTRTHTHT